jgi:hypothetical protein
MKLLQLLLVITLAGATAKLTADTSDVTDQAQTQQALTAAANQTVANASIATMPNIPVEIPIAINNGQPILVEYRGANADAEICRERLDHTVITQADTTTATSNAPVATATPTGTPAAIAPHPTPYMATEGGQPTDPAAAPVVVTSDLTQDELASVDLDEANLEINLISPGLEIEPSLTDKLKFALAFLRMKINLACDATGTAMSNGYDTVTIHLSKHKKAYIIGTVCVGSVLLGVWYFKSRK